MYCYASSGDDVVVDDDDEDHVYARGAVPDAENDHDGDRDDDYAARCHCDVKHSGLLYFHADGGDYF